MSESAGQVSRVRYSPGGGAGHVVTSSKSTGGKLFISDLTEKPGGGPPLHVHSREDELFIVLDGEVTLWSDGVVSKASAGMSVFLPRNIPHTFKNCSDRSMRMLVICTPGDIEKFFDYGMPLSDGSAPPDAVLIERIAALAPQYGITILGASPL